MLTPLDSALDLMLRGFDRATVLSRTGTDIGYNGRALREAARGIDRAAYKVAHVRERVAPEVVSGALALYAAGGAKADVLAELGLAGENIVRLKVLFADLGRAEEFAAADRAARRANMSQGMTEKYGVDNPFKLQATQEAARATRKERYGGEYTLSADSSLADTARETLRERMAETGFRADVVAKRRASTMRSLGVEHQMHSPEVVDRMRETMRERYGVDHWTQTPEARERSSTMMGGPARDGSDRTEAERIRDLAQATMRERYGVENWAQTPAARIAQSERMLDADHQAQITATRRANGTFHVSGPEAELHRMLVETFGPEDVVSQHHDERYPWLCDFYIPSRDLFIELNGLWTHGGHWFDAEDVRDLAQVAQWAAKDTAFYDAAIEQWCVRDVAKRQAAAEHDLNYVVLWGDNRLDDARLWLSMGAPDGRDFEREHSWVPRRSLELSDEFPPLGPSARTATAIARAANWREFYKRELTLWEDQRSPKHGSVAGRLLANRHRHHPRHPLSDQLSDFELLRGMAIAGMVPRYTVFDNTGMRTVLSDHAPGHLYDPCAGWGERLVTAAATGVRYTGVDINPAVVAGHERIIEHYGLDGVSSTVGDAANVDMRGGEHDMVFTCPPYGSTEIYTEDGAENLDDAAFVSWWAEVVRLSTSDATTVFAYQINQRWKPEMNAVLVEAGWRLVEEIRVGSGVSHFHRRRTGGTSKREFEEIQVFMRP